MRLILVDDKQALRWSPHAETRPVGELRFGALLLRERVERWCGVPCQGYRTHADLGGFDEPGVPAILEDLPAPDPGGTLFWLSRAAPVLHPACPIQHPDHEEILVMEGRVVGVWVPPGSHGDPAQAEASLGEEIPDHARSTPVEGELLEWPWDLVERNATVLRRDLLHLHPAGVPAPAGTHLIGDGLLSLARDASVGPGVLLDTREGPIRLEGGVVVDGPARLVGPLHLGPGCMVFGGHLSRLSAGPVCKLRGEVDTAVLLGFSNKGHDGYLGHALLGRWVNLGALTTNSDLKNDYGPVRMELALGRVDTGLMKVGAFLGDHVKTGIGTILNTGTVVGAGSNVFGGGMPPGNVPPFSWCGGDSVVPYRWDKFLSVARTVVARRDQPWTPGVEGVLHRLWTRTHGEAK